MNGRAIPNHPKYTGSAIPLSEGFERLYMSPQKAAKSDLKKAFGNPTPV